MSLAHVTRAEALQLNQKRYFDGLLCVRGHMSERYTSTGGCIDCARRFKTTKVTQYQQLLRMDWPLAAQVVLPDELKIYLTDCLINWFNEQKMVPPLGKYQMHNFQNANPRIPFDRCRDDGYDAA